MPHPVRQMRLRKQRREQTEHSASTHTFLENEAIGASGYTLPAMTEQIPPAGTGIAVRLHKIMADHGLGSRRGLEDAIRDGKITVNGEVAQIGQTIQPKDQVCLEGRPVNLNFSMPTFPRVLMYHKPAGEIVSRDDPEGRAEVFERLPAIAQGRWVSIGRLDLNSEGLLLFTDSGELAHRLMHPRHDIEREYAVRVWGVLTGEQCRKLLQGVQLEDGLARVMSLRDQGGEGANHWYHIVLKEGRYREVRRLFSALELTVSRLIRVRYACLPMPSTLRRGDLEELSPEWVSRLMKVVGLSASHFAATTPDDAAAIVPSVSSVPPRSHRGSGGTTPHPRGSQQEPRGGGGREERGGERSQRRQQGAGGGGRDTRNSDAGREGGFKHRDPRPHGQGENNAGDCHFDRPQDEDSRFNREEGDVNLKGGGGRHPFKRYSQRRVISHQREEVPNNAPPLPLVPPVPPESHRDASSHSSEEDVDALLQQRYAEQERRGELRGLAGQTLGGCPPRSFDGNRQPSSYEPRGYQGSRSPRPSNAHQHNFNQPQQPNQYVGQRRRPEGGHSDNYGNVSNDNFGNTNRSPQSRIPGAPQGEGRHFNRDRRPEGEGVVRSPRPPRPFNTKKGFKKD